MKKYKLTTQELTTYGGFKWEIGKEYTTSGVGNLCGNGFLHYYHHPLLAALLNPIHADIQNPKLFECAAKGIHKDDTGLKGGCTEMTLIKEINLPKITPIQRVAFGILVSKLVYKDKYYTKWADDWLSNKDRSESAARSAESAARSAAWSAAESAARSARSARSAAWSAARLAARSAELAAWSAELAAWSAAELAAWSAAEFLKSLIECAEKCLEY